MRYNINKWSVDQWDSLSLNWNDIMYFSLIYNTIIYKHTYHWDIDKTIYLDPEKDELYINWKKKTINF